MRGLIPPFWIEKNNVRRGQHLVDGLVALERQL